MIVIVDYGVGNLFSLKSSFAKIGIETIVSGDKREIEKADKLILPGVGAFEDAAKKLRENGLGDLVIKKAKQGTPLLGICLGMQLLFEKSFEFGEHKGLGLLKGEIQPMILPNEYKIPHIGWNKLHLLGDESRILKYVNEGEYVYFVHSYHARKCKEVTRAVTDYGDEITAVVEDGNVFGCQFHPEKSSTVGLRILQAFSEID